MHTARTNSSLWSVIAASWKDFGKDKAMLRAAALAYTVAFALPPLLILLIRVAGAIWDPVEIQRSLEGQFSGIVGVEGARTVHSMVASGERASTSLLASIFGVVGLIVGSTGALIALQDALNAIWEVKLDPQLGGIGLFFRRRLFSLGMVMALAFLLVVSLVLTAAITAVIGGLEGVLAQAITLVVSVVVLALVFAAMFKVLPDATIETSSAFMGGIATAVLFEIGKFAIGFYLGHSHPGSAFGAAGDLAVILVWIYYAGALLLFGAEFTRHYAAARGHAVKPKKGSVFIRSDASA
jgi:membrane protein